MKTRTNKINLQSNLITLWCSTYVVESYLFPTFLDSFKSFDQKKPWNLHLDNGKYITKLFKHVSCSLLSRVNNYLLHVKVEGIL